MENTENQINKVDTYNTWLDEIENDLQKSFDGKLSQNITNIIGIYRDKDFVKAEEYEDKLDLAKAVYCSLMSALYDRD